MTSITTPDEGLEARLGYRTTFAVLAVGIASYAMLQSLVSPVLPTIQRELHTSQHTVTWVLTAYLLSASVFTPILGRVGDMFGKKRMFVVALGGLAIGSLLAAVASSIGVMIVARVIQGIGGGVLPLAFGIIRDEFPREKVAGAVGISAALAAAGAGLGIVLAGPIIDTFGYHWLFWLPLIVVTIAAFAAQALVPESRVRARSSFSFWGALLLSAWLVALLVGVSEGSSWGWMSTRTVGLFALAVILGVVWWMVEARSVAPLIDTKMLRVPAVWTTNLSALLFGAGMYASVAFLPEFLQTPKHYGYGFAASITASGIYLLPLTIGMFVFGALSGHLGARFGNKAVLIAGAVLSAIGYATLAFAHQSPWEVYLASAICGIALGLAFSAMSNLIVVAVPPEQTGVATGMNANIRTIGGSVGSAIMGSLVTAKLFSSGVPSESGYTHGFAFLAVATLVAAMAAVLIPTGRRAGDDHETANQPHAELALVPGGTLAGSDGE